MARLKGYFVFVGAAALYLAAVGCVVWPDNKATSKPGEIDVPAQTVSARPNLEGLPSRDYARETVKYLLDVVESIIEPTPRVLGPATKLVIVFGKPQ